MKLNTLKDLLAHELQDLYSAEEQIIEALPMMAGAAKSPELKRSLEAHLEMTRKQKDRLDKVMKRMDLQQDSTVCVGMQGLIKEGQKILKENASPEVLDAALIASAQKVEHYEIAGYGTARTYARMLGETEIAKLLEQTLDEEADTDQKLTRMAVYDVNITALSSEKKK